MAPSPVMQKTCRSGKAACAASACEVPAPSIPIFGVVRTVLGARSSV